MTAELTIGAGFGRALLELAVTKGADRDRLLAQSGIHSDDLSDQDIRIPMSRYVSLMRTAKAMCGDPALALHYGEAFDLSEFSIVGLLTHASETMGEAMVQINRYGRLVVEVDGGDPGGRFQFSRNRGQTGELWLTDTRANPNDFQELTESTFARMACRTRPFGDTPLIKEVYVTHPQPTYLAEYERIFRAPIHFSSDRNALLIDEAWTDVQISLSPRYVFGVFSEHAQALLQSLEKRQTTRGRVESLLMPILHKGDVGIESVAKKLGLSRQTLFRRLRAEGVSFERLLDDLRRELAQHYLSGQQVSVNETAYLVGFSEPAAFSRAFKRWTGISPKQARSRIAATPDTAG